MPGVLPGSRGVAPPLPHIFQQYTAMTVLEHDTQDCSTVCRDVWMLDDLPSLMSALACAGVLLLHAVCGVHPLDDPGVPAFQGTSVLDIRTHTHPVPVCLWYHRWRDT